MVEHLTFNQVVGGSNPPCLTERSIVVCYRSFFVLRSIQSGLARIDYVDVVDFDTITPVEKLEGSILVAIAVYIGKTRLIDNFIVEK